MRPQISKFLITIRIKNSWWIKKFVDKGLRSCQSNISWKVWWNWWGLTFGPERDSNASVSEHVMTRQDNKKVEIVKVWFFGLSPPNDPTVSIRKRRYSFVWWFFIIPEYTFFLYFLFSGTLSSCRSFYDEIIQIVKYKVNKNLFSLKIQLERFGVSPSENFLLVFWNNLHARNFIGMKLDHNENWKKWLQR